MESSRFCLQLIVGTWLKSCWFNWYKFNWLTQVCVHWLSNVILWLWVKTGVSQLQTKLWASAHLSWGSWSQFMHSDLSHQTIGNVTSFLPLLWFIFFLFLLKKKRWGIRNVLGPAPKKWSCFLLPLHLPLHRIPGSRWFPLHALSLSLHCCLHNQLPNSLFTNTFPIFFLSGAEVILSFLD